MRCEKEKVQSWAVEQLMKVGMPEEDADNTVYVLLTTDEMGIHSHGLKNLRGYIEKIRVGALNPNPKMKILAEGASFSVIDADHGMGMVGAILGMNTAVRHAKQTGVGYCCVRNSTHFGAGGVYANIGAESGMFAMAMSNTDPNMAIPGGVGMVIGNNPFAYAYPKRDGTTVFLDIALSATAALKINQAKKDHRSIPDTWLLDDQGNPTNDPAWYGNGGALQPLGMHKGYGLSVMVEALTAMMSNGYLCKDIPSWCFNLEEPNCVCHAFLALDISQISSMENFLDKEEEYEKYIRTSRKKDDGTVILMPGEREWEHINREKPCVEIPKEVVDELIQLDPRFIEVCV